MTNKEKIAEFVGFQLTKIGWFDNEGVLAKIEGDNTFDEPNLKFDQSWDWLMPVVEKIEQTVVDDEIVDVKIERDFCIIKNGTMEDIVCDNGGSKFWETYQAVVLFVNYYNDTKK